MKNKKHLVISSIALLIMFLGAYILSAVYQYKRTISKIDEYLRSEYQKAQSYRIYSMTGKSDFVDLRYINGELTTIANDPDSQAIEYSISELDSTYYEPDEDPDGIQMLYYDPVLINENGHASLQVIPEMELADIFKNKERRELPLNSYDIRSYMIPMTEEDASVGAVYISDDEASGYKRGEGDWVLSSFAVYRDQQGDFLFAVDSRFYYFFMYRCCFLLPEGKTYDLQEYCGTDHWCVQGAFDEEAEALQKKAESISKSNKKSGFSGSDRYLVLSPTLDNLKASLSNFIGEKFLEEKTKEELISDLKSVQKDPDQEMLMDQILFYDWSEEKAALTHDLINEALLFFALYAVALVITSLVTHITSRKELAPEETIPSDLPVEDPRIPSEEEKLEEIISMIDKIEEKQGSNGYLEDIRSEIKAIRETEAEENNLK